MKSKFIIRICALVIAAIMAVPSVAAPTPDRKKSRTTNTSRSSSRSTSRSTSRSNKSTYTRSQQRRDEIRQSLNKNNSNSNNQTNRNKTNNNSNVNNNYNFNSSSSSSSSSATDNTNRKIFLKNQIADWKLKLKKAEKSYEECIASGEDTPEKQRVVESKRNTVNECLEMIRQYEAELNSLK